MRLFFKVCAFCVLIALVQAASTTWGIRKTSDLMVVNEKVFREAVVGQETQVYFDIPISGLSNRLVISAVYVRDQFKNSSGPTNSLVFGGPGWTYGSILLKSAKGVGIDCAVVVYGDVVD